MKNINEHAIVFYGNKDQCIRFVDEEMDENGSVVMRGMAGDTEIEIVMKSEALVIDDGNFIRLNFEGPYEYVLPAAICLMEGVDYMNSVAKVADLENGKEIIFRHEASGFQDCVEKVTTAVIGGQAILKIGVQEDFVEACKYKKNPDAGC